MKKTLKISVRFQLLLSLHCGLKKALFEETRRKQKLGVLYLDVLTSEVMLHVKENR